MDFDNQSFESTEDDEWAVADEFVSRFVKLDPPPTSCAYYGSGSCCKDKHFDPREVMPSMQAIACGADVGGWRATTDKTKVNCKECLELIHA
jgi:hypothetical protein